MYPFPLGPKVHDQSYQTFLTYQFCFHAKSSKSNFKLNPRLIVRLKFKIISILLYVIIMFDC